MHLVPVIDLMDGRVVHARRGERDRYLPIASLLCPNAEPLAIVRALLELHPFDVLYVADLDAILGRGNNDDVISRLRSCFPDLRLWVDRGIGRLKDVESVRRAGAVPVIGSESLKEQRALDADGCVLSLDFRKGAFLGRPEILARPERWPRTLLVMSLERVGAGEGPDLALLQQVKARAGDRGLYLAGGVRNAADIEAAHAGGAAGVLLASALHDGTIGSVDLAALWPRDEPPRRRP